MREPSTEVPWGTIPADLIEPVRPHVEEIAREMVEWIQQRIPEYARPIDSNYGQKMWTAVLRAVSDFLTVVSSPGASWKPLHEIYAEIGEYEARKGRSLESLQTAMRLCGQVAARRFAKETRRLGWPPEMLGQLTESLFAYLDAISEAAAEGYAGARERPEDQRVRLRARLHGMLTGEGLVDRVAITNLARSAGWTTPATIAVVAVHRAPDATPPMLPPHVLTDWTSPAPSLVVPDPDGPGGGRLLAGLRGFTAAVGPTVDLSRGSVSLHWARRALELADAGRLPTADGVVRAVDHLPTLVASAGLDLLEAALPQRLAPLMELTPSRRERMIPTLLAYLETGRNAAAAAQRLQVHKQTVRYRLAHLEEILTQDLSNPDRYLELMLLLHTWRHLLQDADDA
ncbi:helix-turn-helix domain-containing protein [Actinomadura flavalba]|uniref:PucR family transcriptional regulator n=1 Tax=Actinomadura flavalba TaxID=1120938 RepID=UPI00036F6492|nr:helix-turn-helix domain-containing protein [Actinomadura flavalba]